MKLMKATLRRLWHLTRATSIAVSLAVVVALVGGVVSGAVAATPTTTTATAILKGVSNTATAVTTLVNSGTGEALSLEAKQTDQPIPALRLKVPSGNPPLAVNSETKVDKLNADKLDGLDSGAFLAANGTAANATNAANADKLDNLDSTDFLRAHGTADNAANADKLDGKDSTDFMTGHFYVRSDHSGPYNPEYSPGTSNGFGAQQANCDFGDIAVSGGYSEVIGESPIDRITVIRNHFALTGLQGSEETWPGAWSVAWFNDGTPEKVEVWVLCLDRYR